MISILLALAAAPQSEEATFKTCTSQVRTNPEQAVSTASDWRGKGGGIAARQCLGLAHASLERWTQAAEVFEQAAREAETKQDSRRADLWVQSGNSWLAANDGARARKAFDAAVATGQMTPELTGEVYLDRGRAGVALADLTGARKDIDKGLELVPADPFGWYISAALALRQADMARAAKDIAQAVKLAPDDANVLLQAGTIAGKSGDMEAARAFYERAAKAAPESEAGKAAQAALAADAAPTGG